MSCFSNWDIGGCGCGGLIGVLVNGCNGAPVGPGITVNFKVGGSTIATGTTDIFGVASAVGPTDTYDIEVVDGRTPSRWDTETIPGVLCVSGGTFDPVFLSSPKAGFHCSEFCGDPLKDTLTATDPNGGWTLTYDALHPYGSGWYGCATKAAMANVVTSLPPGLCNPATVGAANTVYLIQVLDNSSTISNFWGHYTRVGSERTSSTPTCAAGALNLNANLHPTCIALGAVGLAGAGVSASVGDCPPALSLTATMPATGTSSTANPGAGALTVTE